MSQGSDNSSETKPQGVPESSGSVTPDPVPRSHMQWRHAQKLEALGQLAAGIAHEISTPIQFAGDSVSFLHGALADLQEFAEGVRTLAHSQDDRSAEELKASLRKLMETADVEYFINRVPRAVDRVIDGLGRVASIVRAMKDFSHPDQREKQPADLNEAVERVLVVTRGEYKHVADVRLELAELPRVLCHVGDIQQVLVNLMTNASHALEAGATARGTRGRITIKTSVEEAANELGRHAVISVRDDGGGIPAEIQPHIFDAFFTTKEPGRGTGQGLAISQALIVERHGGRLDFISEPGQGTTFFVRIPI